MTPLKLTIASVLFAVLAMPAVAQSTDTPTGAAEPSAEPSTETQDTAQERADGLSTGQVAEPEREVGSTYVRSEHGDWELRCNVAPEGGVDPCQLYQLLRDQNGNSVAEINLFNLPSDDDLAAGATIITPLETLLTRNVVMSVDGGEAKAYPFTFCSSVGCFSRIGLTDGDVALFKRGSAATLRIVPARAPDQRVELTVSLTGFTAGFDAVTEASTR